MIVCVAEDRLSHEPALRVLLYSFSLANPTIKVVIFTPTPSESFAAWLAGFPNFELRQERVQGPKGWAIKPSVLLRLLDDGYDEVVWLDSDIVVAGPLQGILSRFGPQALVIAEEALAGQVRTDAGAARGRAWGFEVGRTLEGTVNTCVMRVGPQHRQLLTEWRAAMETPTFRDAQGLPFLSRPIHVASDQDVLTAMLTSVRFKETEVAFLRKGKDILQYYGPYGFTTWERLRALVRGMPPLIHSQASVPWSPHGERIHNLRSYALAVLRDTSPYVMQAAKMAKALGGDTTWLAARTRLGRIMRRTGLGSPALSGFLLAVYSDFFRIFARALFAKVVSTQTTARLALRR